MARNFVTAFISAVGGRFLMLASSILLTPAIIAFAGKETYGEFGTLMSAFAIATILMSEGVHSGARKYLSEEREFDDWKNRVFGFYFRLATLLSVLAAVGFVLVAQTGIVSAIWGEKYVPYFYLLAPLAIVAQFRGYLRQSLMGLKLEHISEPVRALYKFTFAVSAIALAYAGFGLAGLVMGHIVGSLITIVVIVYFLAQHVSLRSVFRIAPREFPRRELFSFNSASVVFMLFLMSLIHIDILMVESIVGDSEQTAYYKAALVITQFLWFAPRSLQSLMIQSTSNLWAQGRIGQLNAISSRITRYVLLLTLLLAIGMASLAADFVRFYLGSEMIQTVTPLLILLPGTIGFAIARPILAISQAKGQMRPLILVTGVAAFLNVALNAVLIPKYGIIGAGIATSTGYGTLALCQIVGARHLGYRPFSDIRLGRIVLTAAVSAVPIFLLARAIDNRLLALAIVPIVGLLIYAALTLATGAITPDEIFGILSSAPGPIGVRAAALRRRLEGFGVPLDADAIVPGAALGTDGGGRDVRLGAGRLSPGTIWDRWSSNRAVQAALVALGALLLALGLGLTLAGPGLAGLTDGGAGGDGGGQPPATGTAPPTETPGATTTPTPAPAPEATPSASTSPEPTGTATGTATGTPTEAATPTAAPIEEPPSGASDDDGNPTPTMTAAQTATRTPTAAPTTTTAVRTPTVTPTTVTPSTSETRTTTTAASGTNSTVTPTETATPTPSPVSESGSGTFASPSGTSTPASTASPPSSGVDPTTGQPTTGQPTTEHPATASGFDGGSEGSETTETGTATETATETQTPFQTQTSAGTTETESSVEAQTATTAEPAITAEPTTETIEADPQGGTTTGTTAGTDEPR